MVRNPIEMSIFALCEQKTAVSGEGKVQEEEEVSTIYLRVSMGSGKCNWYVIKTNSDTPDDRNVSAPPVFAPEPYLRCKSACVAVGSTIYSLGGVEEAAEYSTRPPYSPRPPPVANVYYIDTVSPQGGWKKSPHSLNTPRVYPHAFTTNGKIYVLGGTSYLGSTATLMPEVFDTQNDNENAPGWRVLGVPENVPRSIVGHAVLDGGKRVLVHCGEKPHLYCYDVQADSWKLHRENILEFGHRVSATVDGVLYFIDPRNAPGVMFGIEVDDHSKGRKTVILKWTPKDYEWIPQPNPLNEISILPQTHFLSLGKGKLAVVYSFKNIDTGLLHVLCSTIKMSKWKDENDQYQFVADPLCVSEVILKGMFLVDCIALLPSQTRGLQEGVSRRECAISVPGDVSKEDDTVSAPEDVIMEENTIPSPVAVSKEDNSSGGSDINMKKRKLGKDVVE